MVVRNGKTSTIDLSFAVEAQPILIRAVRGTIANAIIVDRNFLQVGDELVLCYNETEFKITKIGYQLGIGHSYEIDQSLQVNVGSTIEFKRDFDIRKAKEAKTKQEAEIIKVAQAKKRAEKKAYKKEMEAKRDALLAELNDLWYNRPEVQKMKALSEFHGRPVHYDWDEKAYYISKGEEVYLGNEKWITADVLINDKNYAESDLVPMGVHFK